MQRRTGLLRLERLHVVSGRLFFVERRRVCDLCSWDVCGCGRVSLLHSLPCRMPDRLHLKQQRLHVQLFADQCQRGLSDKCSDDGSDDGSDDCSDDGSDKCFSDDWGTRLIVLFGLAMPGRSAL